MISALALLLLAQSDFGGRVPRVRDAVDGPRRFGRTIVGPAATGPVVTPAQFEFAPSDGAGMGVECACTTPTGSKGEVITFVRGSSAYCTRGAEFTGLTNSSMTLCASNQPRVMRGGNGAGSLGYLAERAVTNVLLRSEELGNVAWTNASATITADQAVAPWGATVADRIVTTAGNGLSQVFAAIGGTATASCFIKTVSAPSDTVRIGVYTGGLAIDSATNCVVNNTTWTRCAATASNGGSQQTIYVPYYTDPLGHDLYITGCQMEALPYPSSYVATAGSAVARAADTASFTGPTGTASVGSVAATMVTQAVGASGYNYTLGSSAGSQFYISGSALGVLDDSPNTATSTAVPVNGTPNRIWGSWGSSLMRISNLAGVAGADQPFDNSMGFSSAATVYLGVNAGGTLMGNGVTSRLCIDPSPTKCR